MKQVATKELFAYWNLQRGRRAAPERLDIDPSTIRSLLSDTFILDYDQEGGFPFRISGSRTNQIMDRELRLKSFVSLWQDENKEAVLKVINSVADGSVPVLCGVTAHRKGRSIEMEMLLLPLRHHGQTHSRLMGSLVPLSQPEWLGLLPVEKLELTTTKVMEQVALAQKISIADANYRNTTQILDRRAPTTTIPRSNRAPAPQLTVVDGGR